MKVSDIFYSREDCKNSQGRTYRWAEPHLV